MRGLAYLLAFSCLFIGGAIGLRIGQDLLTYSRIASLDVRKTADDTAPIRFRFEPSIGDLIARDRAAARAAAEGDAARRPTAVVYSVPAEPAPKRILPRWRLALPPTVRLPPTIAALRADCGSPSALKLARCDAAILTALQDQRTSGCVAAGADIESLRAVLVRTPTWLSAVSGRANTDVLEATKLMLSGSDCPVDFVGDGD